ncbi:MAG: 2Fe-2S iron-sulfur cluster binding domain-containing protein, partial [Treponema sp.]|nr:2Fe-2S iron-sulfur cluster binding domain-containing protein [Treponema sp.]
MQIPVMLNNEADLFDASPNESLLQALREKKLYKVKCGCMEGHCGNCMVLIDGKPVPSCIVPVAAVRDSNIVTLEFFKSFPEY